MYVKVRTLTTSHAKETTPKGPLLVIFSNNKMTTAEVINWEDAMEQCGEDEEFLVELLGDLMNEVDAQVGKIQEVMQELPTAAPAGTKYQGIMRSAHVIKGSAANLMCEPLRKASMDLEHAASAAHKDDDDTPTTKVEKETVEACNTDLLEAQQNYKLFFCKLEADQ